ncbi:MAG: hypothetical protein HIU57_08450 [Acidobacteria bacterium]|nr:hypothetical protein [Acidobacteriota bacterium]
MKRRSLATVALVATMGMSMVVSDVATTSAYAGGPAAKTFALGGTVVGVNTPLHQFTVLGGTTRYTIMTTSKATYTLNAARTTFFALRVGQPVTVRGIFRARFRVATSVALKSPVPAPVSTVPATAPLTTALNTALNQERNALATYKNVIARIGAVRPFNNIVNSETQHVATLTALMTAHGIAVPASTTTGAVAPATRTLSCQLGVTVETGLIAMYRNGITMAKDFPDVVRAFNNLLDASQSDHLPAFLLCS